MSKIYGAEKRKQYRQGEIKLEFDHLQYCIISSNIIKPTWREFRAGTRSFCKIMMIVSSKKNKKEIMKMTGDWYLHDVRVEQAVVSKVRYGQ